MKKRTALIDGDMLIFNAGLANDNKKKDQDGVPNPFPFHVHQLKLMLKKWLKEIGTSKYVILVGDTEKSNFRYKVAKTQEYKGTRDPNNRPTYESELRDYVLTNHPSKVIKGCEVDDALGCYQMKYKNTIIVTTDKDLDMIPGMHYDPNINRQRSDGIYLKSYKTEKIYNVEDPGTLNLTLSKSNKKVCWGSGKVWFCAQMLLGDKCDNIPKIPRCGDVTTYEFLKDEQDFDKLLKIVYTIYINALKSKLTINAITDRFIEVGRLLWIWRKKQDRPFTDTFVRNMMDNLWWVDLEKGEVAVADITVDLRQVTHAILVAADSQEEAVEIAARVQAGLIYIKVVKS